MVGNSNNLIINSVIEILKTIYDPEIPQISIWDLGLIYSITPEIQERGFYNIKIVMSFTSINCPVADSLPRLIEFKIINAGLDINLCQVVVVWDPPWDKSLISPEALLELDF